jgi:hypothetical protein
VSEEADASSASTCVFSKGRPMPFVRNPFSRRVPVVKLSCASFALMNWEVLWSATALFGQWGVKSCKLGQGLALSIRTQRRPGEAPSH